MVQKHHFGPRFSVYRVFQTNKSHHKVTMSAVVLPTSVQPAPNAAASISLVASSISSAMSVVTMMGELGNGKGELTTCSRCALPGHPISHRGANRGLIMVKYLRKLGWPGVWFGGALFVAGWSLEACDGAGAEGACDSDCGLASVMIAPRKTVKAAN